MAKWSKLVKIAKNGQNRPKWFKMVQNGPKWSKMVKNGQTEMQKAASMASVLVLIFPPAVLIFHHPAQIVIN